MIFLIYNLWQSLTRNGLELKLFLEIVMVDESQIKWGKDKRMQVPLKIILLFSILAALNELIPIYKYAPVNLLDSIHIACEIILLKHLKHGFRIPDYRFIPIFLHFYFFTLAVTIGLRPKVSSLTIVLC